MSDLRRKLFEWLDPDWLEEAGRFPVPGDDHGGHGGGRDGDHGGDHGGVNGRDHGGDHGDIMVIMVEIMVDIMGIMVVIDNNDYLVGILMPMAVIS